MHERFRLCSHEVINEYNLICIEEKNSFTRIMREKWRKRELFYQRMYLYYLCKRLVCSRESAVPTSAAVLYVLLILLRSFFTSWSLRHYSFSRGLLTRAPPSHDKKIRHSPSPDCRNLPRNCETHLNYANLHRYTQFVHHF